MSKGERNYKMWHAKEPNKVVRKKVRALNEKYACPVGTGVQILYKSAKWETKNFEYVHDFGTPKVYFLESQTRAGEAVGKKRTVNGLVCAKTKSSAPEMALLGTVDELTYKDNTGEIVSISGIRGAKLLGCPDNKGLLILSKRGPIFIRGGKMRVTARGIVD